MNKNFREPATMKKLNTIQKRGKLNEVYALDEVGNGGAHHRYAVCKINDIGVAQLITEIQFQHGPRFEEDSTEGLATVDLLEIVRHQLDGFQSGELATRETYFALVHIEEALMWLNRRSEDRLEREVLGTTKA
jgi:hypothetical protein